MKKLVEVAIQSGDAAAALAKIEEYERMCPEDFELFSYYVSYYLMMEDYETKRRCAQIHLILNPIIILLCAVS